MENYLEILYKMVTQIKKYMNNIIMSYAVITLTVEIVFLTPSPPFFHDRTFCIILSNSVRHYIAVCIV